MSLFGPPNIEKLKANGDVNGLIRALNYKINDKSQKREDIDVRRDAAIALGETKNSRAVKPLSNIVDIENEDIGVRRAAVTALGKIGGTDAASGLLDALLEMNTEKEATEALVKIGTPSIEPLVDLFRNLRNLRTKYGWDNGPGKFVTLESAQDTICEALAIIGEPSVDSLFGLSDEFSGHARRYIIKALGKICLQVNNTALNTRVVKLAISSVRHEYDNQTNYHIAKILGQIGVTLDDAELTTQVMESLIYIYSSGRDGSSDAEDILVDSGPKAVESLIAALQDEKYVDSIAKLANILGRIGDRRAIKPLVEAISKPGAPHEAARFLKQLGWEPDNSRAGAAY